MPISTFFVAQLGFYTLLYIDLRNITGSPLPDCMHLFKYHKAQNPLPV